MARRRYVAAAGLGLALVLLVLVPILQRTFDPWSPGTTHAATARRVVGWCDRWVVEQDDRRYAGYGRAAYVDATDPDRIRGELVIGDGDAATFRYGGAPITMTRITADGPVGCEE